MEMIKKSLRWLLLCLLALMFAYCSPPKPQEEVEDGVLLHYPNTIISNIGRVELSKDIRVIATGAFRDCDRLKELSLQGIEQIKNGAFDGCGQLKKVVLQTPHLPKVDAMAFRGTPDDKELIIPTTIEEVLLAWAKRCGFEAINGQSITGFVITSKGKLLAYPLTKVDGGEVVLDDAVVAIAEGVFDGYTELKSIKGNRVKTIGARAFAKTPHLTTIDFPAAETIGDNAFLGATSLSKVALPKVEKVGNFSFSACTTLKEVTLPQIKAIGNGAFAGCAALQSLEIGAELPVVGAESPFQDTKEDKNLLTPSGVDIDSFENWAVENGFSSINGELIEDVVPPPEGLAAEGRKIIEVTDIAKGYAWKVVIPEYFNEIGDKAFANAAGTDFSSITANGVVKVGERAFYAAPNLYRVEMAKLKFIGPYAFAECRSMLSEMKRTPSIEVIGERAFYYCRMLSLVSAPHLKEIGDKAFEKCVRMEEWGILHVGAEPPLLKGELGIKKIAVLVVPQGAKPTYEKWKHRDKFGKILEIGEPGTEDIEEII